MRASSTASTPTGSPFKPELSSASTTTRRRSLKTLSTSWKQTGVQNATFNILTPYPGTPLFARLDAQGRLLTRDWRKYNGRTDVVFQPKQMSPADLLDGFRYANQRFYSLASVAKRLWQSPVQLWWTLPLNLAYVTSWTFRS